MTLEWARLSVFLYTYEYFYYTIIIIIAITITIIAAKVVTVILIWGHSAVVQWSVSPV